MQTLTTPESSPEHRSTPAWWHLDNHQPDLSNSFETFAARVGSIAWLLRNVDEQDTPEVHARGRMLEDYAAEAKALLTYQPPTVRDPS